MNYTFRYLLHGLVWFAVYVLVTVVCLVGNSLFLYNFSIGGNLAAFIASGAAMLAGLYWAHKLACDLVPMGPDGQR